MRSLFLFLTLFVFTMSSFGLERQFKIIKDPETGKDKQVYITGLKTKKRDDGSVLYIMSLKDGYQDGPMIHYSADGKIDEESFYRNDRLEGYYKRYFPNGQLRLISSYEKGLKHGEQIAYYKSETDKQFPQFKRFFDQGLMSGEQQFFNEKGILTHSISYRPNFEDNNEMKHGVEIYYHENEQIRKRQFYVDNRLHGLVQSFHENGQLKSESCYQTGRKQKGLNSCKGIKGKEVIQIFFADGSVKHEYEIKDGKLNGFDKTYSENGQLTLLKHYENDRQNGEEQQYDQDGALRVSYNWKNSLKHGMAKWYFSDGKLSNELNYSKGRIHGEGFKYHPNGNLYISAFFISGRKNGHFKSYTTDNILVRDLNYKDDSLHGISKFYSEGNLTEECKFEEGSFVGCKDAKPLISI